MSAPPPGDGRELEKLIARAIYAGLQRRNRTAYVFPEPEMHQMTTIDGKFYLMAVARHVFTALREASALVLQQPPSE